MLNFRVGPFPVRVYPWFFLSAVLLGGDFGFGWQMLAWIFVVFLSVLVHEMGHAVVGRVFGGHPEIHLQAFGGVTFPQFRDRPGPGRQFILSVAGPIAGLMLGALAYTLSRALPPATGSPTDWTMRQFMWVSVVWAIFNLLPILPLDGGQMMLAVIEGVRRKPSGALASWISAVICLGVAALYTLRFGVQPFMLLWLGLCTF
ncbi:MAG: site-2 protease family protein [Myxococcales bacterium]|nr:site-2 protease family protein [Myxococcales bacterium]